jgi:hydrogenase maturation protein HypF
VGFRPHAYRIAREFGLAGWVRNDGGGVRIEVEGPAAALEDFASALIERAPRSASVEDVARQELEPLGESGLEIRQSAQEGTAVGVQADLAPCAECVRELLDPGERRYRYPFTSCTQCGPRFSILEGLPYDRAKTTMRGFPLCADCRREFDDPGDRRFHAQPLACPACGPRLRLQDTEGNEALAAALTRLTEGELLALKGRGGYQLVCRADADEAVERVRAFKRRPDKPLALMVRDLPGARALCELEPGEEELLGAPSAPIVLLRRRADAAVAAGVAPDLATLGLMLPATPLHLLLSEVGPLVVTSANRSGEPMWIDDDEAATALAPHVDALLVHDRPIANLLDDSVARWAAGRPLLLRRARGYVPLAIPLGELAPAQPVLAHGGHLKATVAVSEGTNAWVSQHVGDLDSPRTREAYEEVEATLLGLRRLDPSTACCDLHPDYGTTRHAEAQGRALIRVQHHEAHVLAVLAEHGRSRDALGIAWDGTGYGEDGTVWGGEALAITATGCERVARLRPFPLPGGEQAVREPRRAALGLLWALDEAADGEGRAATYGAFSDEERRVLEQALRRGVNAPPTSSVGRLFDAAPGSPGSWTGEEQCGPCSQTWPPASLR